MNSALVARLPSSRHADVVYEVRLDADGQYTCSCPGFWRWRKCLHVTALEALKALPVATAPASDPRAVDGRL